MTVKACNILSKTCIKEKTTLLTNTVKSIMYESAEKDDCCDEANLKINEFVQQLLNEVHNFSLRITNKKTTQQRYNPRIM